VSAWAGTRGTWARSDEGVASGTAARTARYRVLGVEVAVTSDRADTLARVEDTYAAFRCTPTGGEDAMTLALRREGPEGDWVVRDGDGYEQRWQDPAEATIDLLGRVVAGLLPRLHARGLGVIHAGALEHRGRALIIAGRSGQGKTTTTLGLLGRGLGLLSDEFAVIEPDSRRILPYRRSLHIRPATRGLLDRLSFLDGTARHHLGGGIEWALTPDAAASGLGARLGEPAPLGHVLVLDGTPAGDRQPVISAIPSAVAALELLQGMWAASVDFEGCLERVARLLSGVPCARLRVGALEATVERVVDWLEETGG
jgi:hypothetical protein